MMRLLGSPGLLRFSYFFLVLLTFSLRFFDDHFMNFHAFLVVQATKFASASGCASACVYGGQPKREQLPAVRAGAPILVATPGRLNDFLEYKDI